MMSIIKLFLVKENLIPPKVIHLNHLKKFHDSNDSIHHIVTVVDGDGDYSVDVPFVPDSLKGPELSESQCQELDTLFSEFAKTVFF